MIYHLKYIADQLDELCVPVQGHAANYIGVFAQHIFQLAKLIIGEPCG
jgi:hypothetical protein